VAVLQLLLEIEDPHPGLDQFHVQALDQARIVAAGRRAFGHLQKPQISANVTVERCMVACRAT